MKIPKNAKKVFTGEIFDIYQWPQKLFNGSTATFEMIKRPDTVQIIATEGNKIITVKEIQPNQKREIGLLGGRVDKGEKPLEAAKRELMEEAGMVAKQWQLLKIYRPIHKMEWDIYYYIARDCQKVAKQNLDGGEKITLIKKTFDQFIKDIISAPNLVSPFICDILKIKLDSKKAINEFKKQIFEK
jgi:ADP-ribose pyrophosphatase YjhB (NUDIX family)